MIVGCGLTVSNIEWSMELMEFTALARDTSVIKSTRLAFQCIHKLAVIITADAASAENPESANKVQKSVFSRGIYDRLLSL